MAPPLEELFAQTSPGLESALAREVKRLGHEPRQVSGGVEWSAPLGGLRQANLWLRTAQKIYLRLAKVRAGGGVDWVVQLKPEALAPVWNGKGPGPNILEVVGGGRRGGELEHLAKRALGLRWGKAAQASADGPTLQLKVHEGEAELRIDTTGEPPLSRRGYRQEGSRAPLSEVLAAGLLELAEHSAHEPLWDGLCGSGTLAIEAAWRARRRAPGRERRFAFEKLAGFDAAPWRRELAQASEQELRRSPAPIWASDLNAGALGTARRNARRAGVTDDLALSREDVAAFSPPAGTPPGLWISNLPYGLRVGERSELTHLYASLFSTWRCALPGWRLAFLVQDAALLEAAAGNAPAQSFAVSNGGLDCQLMVWTGAGRG